MALGAGRVSVSRLLLRDGVVLAGIGLATGFAAATGLVRLVQSFFFGGLAIDVRILAVVGLALILITLIACTVPLRRALRVDPLEALRSE
jgi:ABC-type antimicrobial peptide transport system permease subunit